MVHCTDVNLLSRAALCRMCLRLDEAHAAACFPLRQCLTDTELSQLSQQYTCLQAVGCKAAFGFTPQQGRLAAASVLGC